MNGHRFALRITRLLQSSGATSGGDAKPAEKNAQRKARNAAELRWKLLMTNNHIPSRGFRAAKKGTEF